MDVWVPPSTGFDLVLGGYLVAELDVGGAVEAEVGLFVGA